MGIKTKAILKSYFNIGDCPTEAQFEDLIDTLLDAVEDRVVSALLTFDRDPNAPFGVSAGSAVVTNLDTDKLDGRHETEFAALADIETATGVWILDHLKRGMGIRNADEYAAGSSTGGILEAVNDLPATGGIVIAPPGETTPTTDIVLSASKPLLVIGYGHKLKLGAGRTGFRFEGHPSPICRVVEGFEIDGQGNADAIGVEFQDTSFGLLRHCSISNVGLGAYFHIVGADEYVEGCGLQNSGVHGLVATVRFKKEAGAGASMNENFLENCFNGIGAGAIGIDVQAGCDMYRTWMHNVTMWGGAGVSVTFIKVDGKMTRAQWYVNCESQSGDGVGVIVAEIGTNATDTSLWNLVLNICGIYETVWKNDFSKLLPGAYLADGVAATSDLALTIAYLDVPGCNLSFWPPPYACKALVIATLTPSCSAFVDPFLNSASARLVVDGVPIDSPTASATIHHVWQGGTFSQTWIVSLSGGGQHTLKLQAKKGDNRDTIAATAWHTTLRYVLLPGA